MTMIELCEEYLQGKVTAIKLIRTMSGMFDPDHAVTLLTYICAITRIEEGDLDKETFRKVFLEKPVEESPPESNLELHADGVKEI